MNASQTFPNKIFEEFKNELKKEVKSEQKEQREENAKVEVLCQVLKHQVRINTNNFTVWAVLEKCKNGRL